VPVLREIAASGLPPQQVSERQELWTRPGELELSGLPAVQNLQHLIASGLPTLPITKVDHPPGPSASVWLTVPRQISNAVSHAGQPFAAVHQALDEALQDEGAQRVVPQVVEELARQISGSATE
jgi:hypothetical protein